MFSAEAAITIKKNEQKTERGKSIKRKGDRALSHNGAKTGTCKYSFKSNVINRQAREARKGETADLQMEKEEKR